MKLSAAQIESFLSAPGKTRGVLIYGPDQGLVTSRAKAIAKAILPEGDDAFLRTELREETLLQDPAQLMDALQAMSLLGGRKLIWLRDSGDKSAPMIKDATSEPCENYLLVTAAELGPRSTLRAHFEKSEHLAALPCYVEDAPALARHIRQTLASASISAAPEVITYLSEQLGGDRMMVDAELQRICLYIGDGQALDLETAQSLVESDQEASLDQAAHAFASGQAATLMRTIDALLIAGVAPVMLLRAIDRLLQRLESIAQRMAQGQSATQAVDALRPPVFFKDKPRFNAYAQRFSLPQLVRLRHHVMRLESSVKLHHTTADTRLKDGLLRLCAGSALKSAA